MNVFEKNRFFILLVVAGLFLSGLSISPALGGEGTITSGTPSKITLNVLFMYDEACFHSSASPKCPEWEKLFKEGSKLIYDGTQKQIRFEKIKLMNNCDNASAKADVKIYNDNEGARAHVGGFGTSGLRIRMSQTHKTVTTGTGAGNRGQFGLIHEMGHYFFGLLDEYLDKTGANTADAYCIDQNGTTASIMDGGTTVANANRRTEFCIGSNHRAGHTKQDQKRTVGGVDYENSDSWKFLAAYIKDKHGITLTVPTAVPTSDSAGHVDPTFEYYDCGIRAVTCIDRSGSMGGSKLTMAKGGANSFINLAAETDYVAVTSYDDNPATNYALKQMTAANKTAAKTAVNAITSGGMTNIGGGLNQSLGQITAAGAPVSNEVIILLSDGVHNTGTHPDSVLPSIIARGAKVYTIGIGDADAALMSKIATQTGGTYYFANSSFALKGHFAQIIANLRNDGLLKRIDNKLTKPGPGMLAATSSQVYVDSFTGAGGVTFFLTWDDPAVEMNLEVRRPDGTIVQSGQAGVTYMYDAANADKYYKIANPVVGFWTVNVSSSGTTEPQYSFQVHAGASSLNLAAWAEKGTYTYPATPLLRASITAGDGVAGAQVNAKVTRPDGSAVVVRLYDDGDYLHGDDRKDDGIYSNYFDKFYGDGSYNVVVSFENQNGYTNAYPEDGGTFTSASVPKFSREASTGFVVTGGAPSVASGPFMPTVIKSPANPTPTGQTCQGHCGGPGVGGCYCDSQCVSDGDCCPDYFQYCTP